MTDATFETHVAAARPQGLPARLKAAFGAAVSTAVMVRDATRAAYHAARLTRLSDDHLAAYGLSRETIVAHAFRGMSYR